MGEYVQSATQEDSLLATDGLRPSSKATRVQLSNGRPTIIDDPFTESNELIASYALLDVRSKEEAIERTRTFLELIGGGEIDLWRYTSSPISLDRRVHAPD
jgi:hypothetical protein